MNTETKYTRGPVENIAYMIVKADGSPAAYGAKLPIYWRPSVAERENERLFVGCTVVRVEIPKEIDYSKSEENTCNAQ